MFVLASVLDFSFPNANQHKKPSLAPGNGRSLKCAGPAEGTVAHPGRVATRWQSPACWQPSSALSLKNVEVRTYFTLYPGDTVWTDARGPDSHVQPVKARVRLPCLDVVLGVEPRGRQGRRYGQAAGLHYQWEIMHVCLSTGTECVWQREAKVTLFSYCWVPLDRPRQPRQTRKKPADGADERAAQVLRTLPTREGYSNSAAFRSHRHEPRQAANCNSTSEGFHFKQNLSIGPFILHF